MPLPPLETWWQAIASWTVTHLWQMVAAVVVMVLAYAGVRVSVRLIGRFFRLTRINPQKRKTLQTLLGSAARYLIYILAVLMVLALFGVEIGPLLAGLGIAGLALGFGAQSLVKDVITGFFIIFEDQLHVGDFVEINGAVKGTVEEVGLRMTAIREWSGKKFYLANSEIKAVRNYNREELRAIVTASFPFSEDPQAVRAVLDEVCEEITAAYGEHLLLDEAGRPLEPPQIYGVTALDTTDHGAQFTIIAKTKPASLWTVEKALREAIWRKCRERGIQLAYPLRQIYTVAAAGSKTRTGDEGLRGER